VLTQLSVRAQLPLADGRELHGLPVGAATVCAGQTAHHLKAAAHVAFPPPLPQKRPNAAVGCGQVGFDNAHMRR
jgi:hypothetical protein